MLFRSHHRFSVLAFRAIIVLSFGIQSHHLFSVWHSEPSSLLSYSVQSRHIFSVTTFRVVLLSLAFKVMSSILGVQSHSSLPVSGIQSHYLSIVWRLEPSSYVFSLAFRVMSSVLGVQSYVFSLAFRVTIFPHFGIQTHFSLVLSFRVITLGIHIHWHCTSCLHDFTFVLIFLTSLPCAYRLFIMLF